MRRHIPNQLTILRLVMAAAFFVVLNLYRYGQGPDWALLVANGLFIIGAITDALDGYLARRWKVESRFGRIMDPVCDKVLVLGAFIYLAGPRFVIPEAAERGEFFNMVSGMYPWMVAVMLSRELLVTAIRSELESAGVYFPSKLLGKAKMILQSIVVPIVMLIIWIDPVENADKFGWLTWVRDVLVYVTVGVTALSGWPYITGAIRASRSKPTDTDGSA